MKRLALFGAICVTAVAIAADGASGEADGPTGRQDQLGQVRRATAKYHRIEAAQADGYANPETGHCVAAPGLGGMGVHVVNPSLVFDGVLDSARPEVLLYAPAAGGDLRLVGVEYLLPAAAWRGPGAPNLFGTPFDGPMPEHEPNTTGDHYDQHVWIWSHNPDGVFATWNPAITCD